MNLGIEDETLEFKKTTGELNEAMNSVSAMLNKHGRGTIVFGVMPNGEVRGQEVNDSTLRDVSRKIYECIKPPIVPRIERKVCDGRNIIELSFSGNEKPYSSKGVYYIRSADEDRILPPNELRQLFEYSKNGSWDQEISERTIEDISTETFDRFYKKAVSCGRLKGDDNDPDIVLTKLGLIKNGYLTNAAYYLFAADAPVVLKMAIFATDEKMTFLDINRIKGNIFDLIEKANAYVKSNIRWRAEIKGLQREEIPEIPLKSLREIICNSFAHSRYNANTEHEIDIHPGKVCIYNPGEFPIGYKPEDFVNENLQSVIRNPLILDTLYLSEEVEVYGSGLKNVFSECAGADVEIDYVNAKDGFTFVFKRQNVVNGVVNDVVYELSQDEKIILDILSSNPKESASSMAAKINKSERTVQRILKSLKEHGFVERIGGTKGLWQVKNR
ncbi:MAG: putative DNA binding domain-containing protein [Eubacteriales bacterium]|nr:putative DNA binding domain-containing protein [Eubacteriales bacterium]